VDYLGYVVKVALNLLVLSLNLVNLLLFNVEFVLLATKVLVQIQFDVLLRNQFLLQLQLLSPPLFIAFCITSVPCSSLPSMFSIFFSSFCCSDFSFCCLAF
jgi:hypothetical protein